MLESISDKVIDILYADSRLYAGGTAYAAGWTGVRRIDAGDVAAEGYVNLFDTPYDNDSTAARPGVYLGMRNQELQEMEDFPTISAIRIQHNILTVPLVIVAQSASRLTARKQRNQLRNNIKKILFDHLLETGYWYELTVRSRGSGSLGDRMWITSAGGGGQAVAEAMAVLPVQIRYTWNSTADA